MNLFEVSKRLGSSLDARIIIKHYTSLSDADLIGADDIQITPEQQSDIEQAIEQRLGGRPVSKIIGYKEFYGRNFYVTDDVLDPRPDSEILIESVLDYARNKQNLSILDLGTGSGCLILTLLAELPDAIGTAADISAPALDVARKNATALNLKSRAQLIESNWLESITGEFDIIISNPPYIEARTVDTLDIDVKKYDPIMALDGGDDGLVPYKILFPQIRHILKKGGFVAMEHGAGQSTDIMRLIDNAQFQEIRSIRDLAGHDRVICAIAK